MELISIEDALDMLYNGDLYDEKGNVTSDGYKALATLDGVVLTERKRGKWVVVKEGINTYRVKCSNCGIVLHTGYGFDSKESYMQLIRDACDKYCHDCGAEMEVDDADSNRNDRARI